MNGLYVHLPFCRRRCSYCPFAISVDLRLRDRYVEALRSEIRGARPFDGLSTLYFGGGTPSLMSDDELTSILSLLPPTTSLREVTLEANPEDIDGERLSSWQSLGIDRLSVGVQSLHDDELRPLGRLHGRERAIESLKAAAASGFRTNADLIIGLPGQTRERFVESLEGVLQSGAGHLSLYVLDLDEDTPLRRRIERGRVTLPDEDLVVDLYMEAVERCARAGLEQYEISNFARPGEESLHNASYWTRAPYRGVGLGAHSFDGHRRFSNVRGIAEYLDRFDRGESFVDFEESISATEATEEEIFLSLRRREGIALERVRELRPGIADDWIDRALSSGFVKLVGDKVAFTPRGFIVSSELIAELF